MGAKFRSQRRRHSNPKAEGDQEAASPYRAAGSCFHIGRRCNFAWLNHSTYDEGVVLNWLSNPGVEQSATLPGLCARMKRLGRWVGGLLCAIIAIIAAAWAFGAVWFDGP